MQSEVCMEQCWLYSLTAAGRTCDFTPGVDQSVAEGAAQCCDSDLQVAGQRWQLVHHPALSHHLHWVKRASQDGAGLLDKFSQPPPVCCWDADATTESLKEMYIYDLWIPLMIILMFYNFHTAQITTLLPLIFPKNNWRLESDALEW